MTSSPKASLQRKCPICGKPTDPAAAPFCSKRCADIDLHRWLSGSYAIPAAPDDSEADSQPDSQVEPEAGQPRKPPL